MKERHRDRRITLGLAIGVPVSLVFGWLAFRGADPGAVVDALADVSPGRLVAGAIVLWCVYPVQALRWRLIAATPELGVGHFLGMVVGGVAMNNVLPGRIGDVLRVRWLAVDARIPYGRSLASVVLDRAGDVVALALLLFVSVWSVPDTPWLKRIAAGAALIVAMLAAGLILARAYSRRRPRARRGRGRLRKFLRDTLDGLAEPLGRRRGAVVIGASILAWALFACAAILIASSVGIELSLVAALFVASTVNLGVAIPSSPGFVGTYQWLAVESLALVGVEGRDASLAFGILLHAAWYVPTTLVGGAWVVVRLLRMRTQQASRAKSANAPAGSVASLPVVDDPPAASVVPCPPAADERV